jgi:5-formyltetrahydrofolate cyclo-ligase
MEKRALRRQLFARVRALPPEARAQRSAAIRASLLADPAFRAVGTVFAYLSLPGEPDLSPLLGALAGQRWAFARVGGDDRLVFHQLDRPDEAAVGPHGIREPDPTLHPALDHGAAEIILVPGVGFDPATRARLGRGRGHYDRFLAAYQAGPRRPQLVGISFSEQLAPVPVEAHDIPMDRLLTDRGWA